MEKPQQARARPPPLVTQRHTHSTYVVMTEADEAEQRSEHQPTPPPHLTLEEVCSQEHVQVATEKLSPGHGCLARRGRGDAMALEDIPYCLITDPIAQVLQSALDAIIAPGTIFAGHADHHGFNLVVNSGPAYPLGGLRGGRLLVSERAVPSEDRIGLGNRGDFLQGLLPQLGTKLSKFLAFVVSQLYATGHLMAQDAIFCHQIVIAKPQVLVQRSRDGLQKLLPTHTSLHPCHDV